MHQRKMYNPRPTADVLNSQSLACNAAARAKGFYDAPALCPDKQTAAYLQRQGLLIAGEVFELYEALRSGKINPTVSSTKWTSYSDYYKEHVKGTAAEELADIVIRIYDCSGAINADYKHGLNIVAFGMSIDDDIKTLANYCVRMPTNKEDAAIVLFVALEHTYTIADILGVDIEDAINSKFKYNASREHKHGKRF